VHEFINHSSICNPYINVVIFSQEDQEHWGKQKVGRDPDLDTYGSAATDATMAAKGKGPAVLRDSCHDLSHVGLFARGGHLQKSSCYGSEQQQPKSTPVEVLDSQVMQVGMPRSYSMSCYGRSCNGCPGQAGGKCKILG